MTGEPWKRASLVVMVAFVASACGAVATATPAPTSTPTPTASPPASASPSPQPSAAQIVTKAAANGSIVFRRTDDARSVDTPFMIDPDGSHETAMHEGGLMPGAWSPDGTRLLLYGVDHGWHRPAVINADGSGFRLLDAYPDRKMHLDPVAWSPDGSHLLIYSGGEDVDSADVGLYTVRSSDGGNLIRVTTVPPGSGDATYGYSPDGSRILFSLQDAGTLYVIHPDGTGLLPIAKDLHVFLTDFFDPISAAWSPDGSKVAFCAQPVPNPGDMPNTMYLVNPDGSDLHQLVPSDVGAVSAQWSPDGQVIAFTSKLRSQPQVWVVHPDGSGLKQLTDGADGSTSVTPVWSPDGTKLLFQRKLQGHVTLWTMNADGTRQLQLTKKPLASDYVDYAWWPAPAH